MVEQLISKSFTLSEMFYTSARRIISRLLGGTLNAKLR